MTAGFVAGVLEGFEGTLDAVLEQLTDSELRSEVEALQDQIALKRRRFEEKEAIEVTPHYNTLDLP